MVWEGGTFPDGAKNLPDNRVGIANNFTYIETKLDFVSSAGVLADHYFKDTTDLDRNGHHKQVALQTETTDNAIPPGMSGVLYTKTAEIDDGTNQHHGLCYRQEKTADTIYQLTPGVIWAFAVFKTIACTGVAEQIVPIKQKNVKYVSAADTGITGILFGGNYTYTLKFLSPTPDKYYMVYGQGIANFNHITPTTNAYSEAYCEFNIRNREGDYYNASGATMFVAVMV